MIKPLNIAGVTAIALSVATPSRAQQATASEVYGLRERCGKLAASVFEKEYSGASNGKTTYNYENHYSVKLNKCFFVEISGFVEKSKRSLGMRLYDLNENKEYGHYFESSGYNYTDCLVGEQRCSSEKEWRQLTKPYLDDERGRGQHEQINSRMCCRFNSCLRIVGWARGRNES